MGLVVAVNGYGLLFARRWGGVGASFIPACCPCQLSLPLTQARFRMIGNSRFHCLEPRLGNRVHIADPGQIQTACDNTWAWGMGISIVG